MSIPIELLFEVASDEEIAAVLDLTHPRTVYNWRRTGEVPRGRQFELAHKLGIALPAQFFSGREHTLRRKIEEAGARAGGRRHGAAA